MSDPVAQNRELQAKVIELRRQLQQELDSNYRHAWQVVSAALDAAAPGWREAGPTAETAASAIIRSADYKPQVGWLAVRDTDTQFVLTKIGASSFERQGYTLLAVCAMDVA